MPGYDVEAALRRLDEWVARQKACIAEIEARPRDACQDVTLDRHRRWKALHERHQSLLIKAASFLQRGSGERADN